MKPKLEHDWLDSLSLDDPAWLALLVDNELSVAQRQRYVQFLQQQGDSHWRRCALAFLDEQVIQQSLDAAGESWSTPTSSTPPKAPKGGNATSRPPAPGRRTHTAWIGVAAAACLLIGLLVGRWSVLPTTPRQTAPVEIAAAEATPVKRPASRVALIQVADDWDHAEFEIEGVAPRFLMDALLFAGHSIVLEQRVATTDDAAVNVMRINKFGQLLAEQTTR